MRGRSLPTSERISDFDLGWAAGFVEGEGSFHIVKPGKGEGRYPRITVQQKQREPLERLMAILGGRIRRTEWGGTRAATPGIWTWYRDGPDASSVMRMLRPHMSPRRQAQIDKVCGEERRFPTQGEGNIGAILTAADVLLIRSSDERSADLARRYGVNPSAISKARRGITWSHL